LQLYPHTEKSFFHFSFLRDIKVHGIYYNSFDRYLSLYPFIKKEHYHNYYTILLFTEGNSSISVNNNTYSVQPQTICLIPPNQMHSFEGLEKMKGLVFFFCQDFYIEEFSFIRLLNVFSCTSQIAGNISNPCINLSDMEFNQVIEIIRFIEREYEHCIPSNNSVILIRSLLNIMLLKLSEFYDAKSEKSNKSDSIFIHELSRLVDSYFINEHNVGFYTSTFNVSEKQLNEICNKNFNCGLKKILKDRLMQEARKLLLSTELSVSEISYKLNFDDNSYFNKVFKKQTGLTPKRFRDIHKKLIP
jgi:AraC family transcriptional regulator, transcriptional activator of pobA